MDIKAISTAAVLAEVAVGLRAHCEDHAGDAMTVVIGHLPDDIIRLMYGRMLGYMREFGGYDPGELVQIPSSMYVVVNVDGEEPNPQFVQLVRDSLDVAMIDSLDVRVDAMGSMMDRFEELGHIQQTWMIDGLVRVAAHLHSLNHDCGGHNRENN